MGAAVAGALGDETDSNSSGIEGDFDFDFHLLSSLLVRIIRKNSRQVEEFRRRAEVKSRVPCLRLTSRRY